MNDCLFCKIVKQEVPANIVYEDELTIAFLDIFPAARGHTLVIPKKHSEFLYEMEEENSIAAIKTVLRVSEALSKMSQGVSVLQRNGKSAGQVVPHVHFHIIPRLENDEVSLDQWDGKTDTKDKWDLKEISIEIQKHLN
jgi:histidine triad (HIT) family protein